MMFADIFDILRPVACRGSEGGPPTPSPSPLLSFGCQIFPKDPFGIFLHQFLADKTQSFSKVASGANITNFVGERAKKTSIFELLVQQCPPMTFENHPPPPTHTHTHTHTERKSPTDHFFLI